MTERKHALECDCIFCQYADRIDNLTAEVERLNKRDCTATVQLTYQDGIGYCVVEDLVVVDVSVSENIYMVESKLFERERATNQRLRDALELGIKFTESIMPQLRSVSCDIGLLNDFLCDSKQALEGGE